MSGGEWVIRWSTALAMLGVAAVAAVASYERAYALVRAHGERGWTTHLVPLKVDGLIYASSMVMLDSIHRKTQVPHAGAMAPRLGRHGNACGQHRPRPRPWPDWCGCGCVAGCCAGRLVRTPHGGHPEFSGTSGRACPADGETRTRCRKRPPRCSPSSLRQTGFPRSVRSARSSKSASHVHSVCGTTLPQGRQARSRTRRVADDQLSQRDLFAGRAWRPHAELDVP
jgi:Protein of unknown function (DUF2637)